MKQLFKLLFCLFSFFYSYLWCDVKVGVSSFDITPPIGTPSAGFQSRKGDGMIGIRDQLQANTIVVDNEESVIAFCSVDHLGYDRSMIKEIKSIVEESLHNEKINIIIGSTHTHSGGGAFLNYPLIGESLAGKFDIKIRNFYIKQTANSIIEAYNKRQFGKIGIGYGILEDMNQYRGKVPTNIGPRNIITVIKITTIDNTPLGIIFNFACHPVILHGINKKFSADFVGSARLIINEKLNNKIVSVFFNGAQGDVNPNSKYTYKENYEQQCDIFGKKLAEKVYDIWNTIQTNETININYFSLEYSFDVKPTSQGLILPVKIYNSEINFLVLDRKHAFLTVPGELTCIYDYKLREEALKFFDEFSILGLVNDAHGYILTPESWDVKSPETNISFGGREYGLHFYNLAQSFLLQTIEKIDYTHKDTPYK